ncbi:histidine phosphatase family protein [Thalassoglobus sp.]|uniref:histidine phosphatase family protein n=1 Tax=Thalassoglobus sp. TaxID=2795869 RepID=UPI003AA84A99
MTIYLIRPGETDYDVQKRLQGSINLPLTEQGVVQVDEMVTEVSKSQLDRIYSSPTEPALSTAKRIASKLGITLKVLDSLANVDLGLWQGLCISEIRSKQPKVFKQWKESPESVCPPQGEDGEEACQRIAAALRKPMKRGKSIAIVASEPLASLIECHLQGREPELSESFCKEREVAHCQAVELPSPVPK